MALSANQKRSASLAAVCLQSTALAIVINLSQHVLADDHQPYKASSAVLITELGKLTLSTGLALWEGSREHQFERAKHTPVFQAKQLFSVVIDGKEHEHQEPSKQRDLLPAFRLPSSALLWSPACTTLWRQVFSPGILHMAVPAALFLTQNNLIYVAARNLSIPVFQISFQLKTVITALMAVVMLRRRYNTVQWASLLLLGIGVAAVQLGAHATPHATHSASESNNISSAHPAPDQHSFLDADQLLGLMAVVISCFASAIAATYFELILKKAPSQELPVSSKYKQHLTEDIRTQPPPLVPLTWRSPDDSTWDKVKKLLTAGPAASDSNEPTSLWIRNIQLSLFSLLFSWWLSWWSSAGGANSGDSFFEGFNVFTWLVIFIQTVGGLLTAMVIKYADNVAKGFALSASAVLTFALSIAFLDYELTPQTAFGAFIVLATAFSFECHAQVSASLADFKTKYLPSPPSSPDSD